MALTKKEILEAFGVTLLTVDNWAASGRIQRIPQTQNGKILYSSESVKSELDRQRAELLAKLEKLSNVDKLFPESDGALRELYFPDDEDWI